MPDAPILVTGATGNIGRHVTGLLREAGREVRAAALDPSRGSGVRFDFTDPATWRDAFAGVEVMFLMRPPALSRIGRDMVPALEAAKAAGVRHMVLLSLQGAENNRLVPHAKIESWLRTSGLTWTFVRPSFFMENLSGTHAPDIRDRDEIFVPAGNGATSFVAASDVAAVAGAALLDPAAHSNRAWTPTGPSALTYSQVAAILSEALARPIRYRSPGVLRYARHARSQLGMPWGMVGVTTGIYTIARLGKAAEVTSDVATVTARAPETFAQWASAHRTAWLR